MTADEWDTTGDLPWMLDLRAATPTTRKVLLLKARRRSELQAALRAMLRHAELQGVPRKAIVVDVDAVSLM